MKLLNFKKIFLLIQLSLLIVLSQNAQQVKVKNDIFSDNKSIINKSTFIKGDVIVNANQVDSAVRIIEGYLFKKNDQAVSSSNGLGLKIGTTFDSIDIINGKQGKLYDFLHFVFSRPIDRKNDSIKFHTIYNTNLSNHEVYKSIRERHHYYIIADEILKDMRLDIRWYEAAGIVTSWNGIGAAEYDLVNYLGDATTKFLAEGNKYLFAKNMENFMELVNKKSINKIFITAMDSNNNTDTINLSILSNAELDYAMVKYEQTEVQKFIDNYFNDDVQNMKHKVMKKISNSFYSIVCNEHIAKIIKEHFTKKGRRFDFSSYENRVELGHKMLDKIRGNKTKK